MNTTTTLAERILTHTLRNDGCSRKTRGGHNREVFVRRIGARFIVDGDCVVIRLRDGSEIHDYAGGWDTPAGWAENV